MNHSLTFSTNLSVSIGFSVAMFLDPVPVIAIPLELS